MVSDGKNNHKVVCVTPAGRRRYMRLLVPYVLASPVIDRYDVWINTVDKNDIEFFLQLEKKFPKIHVIPQPEGIINGVISISSFFQFASDENTIYIRLDDDIVWLEPDFFEKLIAARIEDKTPFLVAPLIINNALCTHLLQQFGSLNYHEYLPAYATDWLLWESGRFAAKLHKWFLEKIQSSQYQQLHFGRIPIALNRFSINAISWFGKSFQNFSYPIIDEEEYLTVIHPAKIGASNCIDGRTIAAHYAFYPQRPYLDKTSILQHYHQALKVTYSNESDVFKIYNDVQLLCNSIEKGEVKTIVPFVLYQKPRSLKKKILEMKIPVVFMCTVNEIKRRLFSLWRKPR